MGGGDARLEVTLHIADLDEVKAAIAEALKQGEAAGYAKAIADLRTEAGRALARHGESGSTDPGWDAFDVAADYLESTTEDGT